MFTGSPSLDGTQKAAAAELESLRTLPSAKLDPTKLNHLLVLKERYQRLCATTIDSFQVPITDIKSFFLYPLI